MKRYLSILLFVLVLPCCIFASKPYFYDQVSFILPEALEVQSDLNRAIFKALTNAEDDETFEVKLTQKGLNDATVTANSQYCRVIITIKEDDSEYLSNEDYKEEYDNYSKKELQELNDLLESMVSRGVVLKKWYQIEFVEIDGFYSMKTHYIRSSTSGNSSDVDVINYDFNAGKFNVGISCSYRIADEKIFKPAINSVIDSLEFNFNDDKESSSLKGVLYEHIIPNSSIEFQWPEKNVSWETSSVNPSITFKLLQYESDYSFLILNDINYNISISDNDSNMFITQLYQQLKKKLATNYKFKNLKLIKDKFDNDEIKFSYSYSSDYDDVCYGLYYLKKLSNTRYINLSGQYFKEDETIINNILDSMF